MMLAVGSALNVPDEQATCVTPSSANLNPQDKWSRLIVKWTSEPELSCPDFLDQENICPIMRNTTSFELSPPPSYLALQGLKPEMIGPALAEKTL
jgi:hypothetical protein